MPDAERTMIETQLTEIKTMLKTIMEQGKDHETRLRALEGEKGKKWDSVATAILSAIVVGVVGFFLGKFI
jgi:hypothetical protein